jgi:hypothetical protein
VPLLQADREALSAQLSSMEDWLYDEGEDETKSVYIAKLAELKAKGDPIAARAAEDETRPGGWQGRGRAAQVQHAALLEWWGSGFRLRAEGKQSMGHVVQQGAAMTDLQ